MNVDVCALSFCSDPDEQELERMMVVGQRVTWPKVSFEQPILLRLFYVLTPQYSSFT